MQTLCSNASDGAWALPCPNPPSCYTGGLRPHSGRADLLGGHPGARGGVGGRAAVGPVASPPLTSKHPRWKRAAERLAKQTDTSGLPGSSWDAACGDQRAAASRRAPGAPQRDPLSGGCGTPPPRGSPRGTRSSRWACRTPHQEPFDGGPGP